MGRARNPSSTCGLPAIDPPPSQPVCAEYRPHHSRAASHADPLRVVQLNKTELPPRAESPSVRCRTSLPCLQEERAVAYRLPSVLPASSTLCRPSLVRLGRGIAASLNCTNSCGCGPHRTADATRIARPALGTGAYSAPCFFPSTPAFSKRSWATNSAQMVFPFLTSPDVAQARGNGVRSLAIYGGLSLI